MQIQNRVHEFFEKLKINVDALDTMGELRDIKGYVRLTLEKIPGNRIDRVRLEEDWQKWDFP